MVFREQFEPQQDQTPEVDFAALADIEASLPAFETEVQEHLAPALQAAETMLEEDEEALTEEVAQRAAKLRDCLNF